MSGCYAEQSYFALSIGNNKQLLVIVNNYAYFYINSSYSVHFCGMIGDMKTRLSLFLYEWI